MHIYKPFEWLVLVIKIMALMETPLFIVQYLLSAISLFPH